LSILITFNLTIKEKKLISFGKAFLLEKIICPFDKTFFVKESFPSFFGKAFFYKERFVER